MGEIINHIYMYIQREREKRHMVNARSERAVKGCRFMNIYFIIP